MQLRQAELVGAADDDGVGAGHVDAGLDDGRAQQQVVALPATNSRITRSSSRSGIWPWATAMRASGISSASFGAGSRWSRPRCAGSRPGRRASTPAARPRGWCRCSRTHEGLDGQAPLRRGGDDAERSRRPSSAMPSVRGIGVAVSVSTSTSARSAFIASLWRTPKRCSSSITSRPRRANLTSGDEQLVRADDDVDVPSPALRSRS